MAKRVIPSICPICDKEFLAQRVQVKDGRKPFCSHQCAKEHQWYAVRDAKFIEAQQKLHSK